MTSLSTASHEHHDRLMPHVDRLAELADMLGDSVPPGFGEACEAEHRFITGQLLPHIDAIEMTLYGELDRLMQGRHSMAPMRREHAELRRLIASMGQYHELVSMDQVGPAEVIGLRRALYRLHAMLRVHLAEELLYLRVLDRNLSADEIDQLARGIEHAIAEPM
jgi:hypothetical protein